MSDEPIIISDADQEEWHDYDQIKVTDGLELDGHSKATTEYIERTNTSPVTMIDTPWPNDAWRICRDHVREQIRSTMFPELRDSRMWAYVFFDGLFKSGIEGRRPAHEQFTFIDMMHATSPDGRVDREATRCVKDTIYHVHNNEYLGRGVG